MSRNSFCCEGVLLLVMFQSGGGRARDSEEEQKSKDRINLQGTGTSGAEGTELTWTRRPKSSILHSAHFATRERHWRYSRMLASDHQDRRVTVIGTAARVSPVALVLVGSSAALAVDRRVLLASPVGPAPAQECERALGGSGGCGLQSRMTRAFRPPHMCRE